MITRPDIANCPPLRHELTNDVEIAVSHPFKRVEPFRVSLGTLVTFVSGTDEIEGAAAARVDEESIIVYALLLS